jgi:hypothetical protein
MAGPDPDVVKYTFEVKRSDTAESVMSKIQNVAGVSPDTYNLRFPIGSGPGVEVQNDWILSEYDISKLSLIFSDGRRKLHPDPHNEDDWVMEARARWLAARNRAE